MPRYIDAEFAEKEITSLVAEYENRMPEWSPDDMLTSGKDAAMKYGYKADGAEKALEIVNKIPTAYVQEIRHGHWINGNCGDYVCSVCGWAFSDELPYMAREYDAETEEIMRYCMHCGSRLELQGGAEMDIYEEIKKIKEENAALRAKVEELTEKHWDECRQIALYDDELKGPCVVWIRNGGDEMLSNDIKKAIANTNIGKYRKILLTAINAHPVPTEYDVAFHRGMEHALYLLDQMCRNEWERAKNES